MSCHFHMLRKRKAAQKLAEAAESAVAKNNEQDGSEVAKTAQKPAVTRKKATKGKGDAV